LPSAVSDLQSIFIGFRDDSNDSAGVGTTVNRLQNFRSFNNVYQFQLFIESKPYYSEPLTGDKTTIMLWQETKTAEPAIKTSRFYTDYEAVVDGTLKCPPIVLNLKAAPAFHSMQSGVTTSRHTVEAYADVTLTAALGPSVNAYCFMKHTVRIYQDANGQLSVQR
jgi:hypothetical protein